MLYLPILIEKVLLGGPVKYMMEIHTYMIPSFIHTYISDTSKCPALKRINEAFRAVADMG